jgi:hypothetical protein
VQSTSGTGAGLFQSEKWLVHTCSDSVQNSLFLCSDFVSWRSLIFHPHYMKPLIRAAGWTLRSVLRWRHVTELFSPPRMMFLAWSPYCSLFGPSFCFYSLLWELLLPSLPVCMPSQLSLMSSNVCHTKMRTEKKIEQKKGTKFLVYSLSLHRHSYIGFILAFASSIHNKQKKSSA